MHKAKVGSVFLNNPEALAIAQLYNGVTSCGIRSSDGHRRKQARERDLQRIHSEKQQKLRWVLWMVAPIESKIGADELETVDALNGYLVWGLVQSCSILQVANLA